MSLYYLLHSLQLPSEPYSCHLAVGLFFASLLLVLEPVKPFLRDRELDLEATLSEEHSHLLRR